MNSMDSLSMEFESMTSVPEAKKEEQEQEVVRSRPSSTATTGLLIVQRAIAGSLNEVLRSEEEMTNYGNSPLILHDCFRSTLAKQGHQGMRRIHTSRRTVLGWALAVRHAGFAVQYISIMLPSQTRHLMCQSQTVVLPSPLPLFRHMRRRVTIEEGTTSFSFALLNLPFLIENSKPLHYWYRDGIPADDLEEMDISYQMTMISYRAKKFYQRTGRQECKSPSSQPSTSGQPNHKASSSSNSANIAEQHDFSDWSFQAQDASISNNALMANDSTY
ncbi:hypothetical protein E3N88_22973 [Mikania micrantha]|uniref:Uncharacterized protein n=1 Tax=Mikania micrantha TaxID=192012 RepID=A0A5N6NC02_9ASTR|nr:hypothetical protein E3N88_22973 [Mikania micrantha]